MGVEPLGVTLHIHIFQVQNKTTTNLVSWTVTPEKKNRFKLIWNFKLLQNYAFIHNDLTL